MKLRALIASFAALAGVITAQAADYYWIGGASGDWADGNNWSLTAGGAAAAACPSSGDGAVFTTSATVNLTADANCSSLILNADVVLIGGKQVATTTIATGDDSVHSLTLSSANIRGAGDATISANVALNVATGTSNKLIAEQGKKIDFCGSLLGSGTLICSISGYRTNGGSVIFKGTTSEFTGSVRTENNSNARASHQIAAEAAADNASSSWTFNQGGSFDGGGSSYTTYFPFRLSNQIYRFGALSGVIPYAKGTKGWLTGVTLEVGARNEDCELTGQFGPVTATEFDWVASTATIGYSVTGTTCFKLLGGGTAVLTNALPTKIVFAQKGGVMKTDLDPSAMIQDSTAAMTVDTGDEDATWTAVLAASNVGGLTKRGSGTLTLTAVPAYTGTTTIEEGSMLFPVGSTIERLDVKEGATIGLYTTVAYTDPTDVLTISAVAEDVDLKTAFPNTVTMAFEFVVDEETGVVTVKATRAAAVFTWTGAASEAWENAANWTVGGEVPETAPMTVDSVVFPATESMWTVEMNAEHVVAGVAFNGTTKLIGASLRPGSITGEGRIVLGDAACIATYQGPLAISNAVEIVASAEAPAELRWSANSQDIELAGEITGTGVFKGLNTGNANYAGIKISGDMTGFTGTFMAPKNAIDRNMSGVRSVASVSSNAIYHVEIGNGVFMNVPISSKLSFGMLTGYISQQDQSNVKNLEVEIDCLGRDGSLAGSAFATAYPGLAANRGHTFKKVGAGTIQFSLRLAKEIDINNGVLEMASDQVLETDTHNTDLVFGGGTLKIGEGITVDPSAHIKASDANIQLDVSDNRTFAKALPSMNGGLIKKGAGTLTLEMPPLYTGVTTVEAGELVVPAETRIHWDILSTGKLTGAQPTSYDYQVGTTNVYDSAAAVPSAGNHTLNLDNLLAIDLTSVTTVEKNSKFVIAEAKAFNVDGKAIDKAGRENIELIWGKDTVFPNGKTAADYTLQVVNGQLVVANKAVGIAIIIK